MIARLRSRDRSGDLRAAQALVLTLNRARDLNRRLVHMMDDGFDVDPQPVLWNAVQVELAVAQGIARSFTIRPKLVQPLLDELAEAREVWDEVAIHALLVNALTAAADLHVDLRCLYHDGSELGRWSRWLVTCAVQVLPSWSRPRYLEEFEAELLDLAGQPAWRRFRHALRVCARAVPLRQELRPVQERVR